MTQAKPIFEKLEKETRKLLEFDFQQIEARIEPLGARIKKLQASYYTICNPPIPEKLGPDVHTRGDFWSFCKNDPKIDKNRGHPQLRGFKITLETWSVLRNLTKFRPKAELK